MHEWSLAEAIVKSIEHRAEELKTNSIDYVEIIIGELQQIDEEILSFALNELLKSLIDEKKIVVKELKFSREEAVFKCNVCGYTWRLSDYTIDEEYKESIHFIPEIIFAIYRCPKCKSSDFDIVGGRGISIRFEKNARI